MIKISHLFLFIHLSSFILATMPLGQQTTPDVKQPAETLAAYRVCEQFQKVLSQNLDFAAAYDATFVTDKTRQRAVAIKEGEFDLEDYSGIDDQTLINAYKSRMQLVYLMFPLASPDSGEENLFFPPLIKEMFLRKPPKSPQGFPSYAAQVDRDAKDFRAHLDRLALKYSTVAERVRKFKSELVMGDFKPPATRVVEPIKYSGGGGVMKEGEPYYEIEGYTVVRENGQMKIAGIRFFTRLF